MKNLEQIILDYLSEITDPEIPVVNIVEMGIVKNINAGKEGVEIEITPTYSGCPAMQIIKESIIGHLYSKGFHDVKLTTVYSPAWTTDWITDEAKSRLKEYGIAPPENSFAKVNKIPLFNHETIACPFCNSVKTEIKSNFGSTLCKSFYYCNSCRQMFEYFKCI